MRRPKPGKVQAVAIMQLVSGIIAVVFALLVAGLSSLLWIPWIYALVVGILAIIRGAKLMGDGAFGAGNSRAVPILLIINVINCDVIGLVCGILCLVFQSESEVDAYLGGRPPDAMSLEI